jgi:hypothetical protein
MPLNELDVSEGKFLDDKSCWFNKRSFEYVDLKAKYRPLVGNGSVLKGI